MRYLSLGWNCDTQLCRRQHWWPLSWGSQVAWLRYSKLCPDVAKGTESLCSAWDWNFWRSDWDKWITHTCKAFLLLSVCLWKQIYNLEDMKGIFWASVTFTAIRKSKPGNHVKSHDVKTFCIFFHTKKTGLSHKWLWGSKARVSWYSQKVEKLRFYFETAMGKLEYWH